MEAAFVVYLIGQLDDWSKGCAIVALVSGLTIFFLGFFNLLEGLGWPKKRYWVAPTVVFVLAILLEAILPSKKTAEYMAGAYGVQYAVQSKTGQQVLDKSGKIVNNVLDLAIQKTTPSK